MEVFVGIDLGSTTCKAVVLDEEGRILGKGITNTRSNYNMATRIAVHEAMTAARFSLLCDLCGLSPDERQDLELFYYLEDYRHKFALLRDLLLELAAEQSGTWVETVREICDRVSAKLNRETIAEVLLDRAHFFKDLMLAFFFEEAERTLPAGDLPFDPFLGLLDKALVRIENEVFPMEPEEALKGYFSGPREEILATLQSEDLEIRSQVGTGYGRQLLPFPPEQIRSEILCHAKGAYACFPGTRTILDIGGQDTKAIQLDDTGVVRSFFMNDRCAAGCGRYLGYVAEEFSMSVTELGPLACQACRYIPISSTCTVFAGAELRDLLYAGEKKEEILLGLHRAIVLRALSLLARSGGIFNEFTFTGGVARNPAVVRLLRDMVAREYGELTINIHPDSIFMGALGAAMYARENA
jgi:benzoyl-CoA reductase subunit A